MLKSLFTSGFKSPSDKKLAVTVNRITGFSPKNVALYKQAFRHTSASQEIKEGVKNSNERLEYLGDAVLGAIVAEYLFQLYPFKGEGFLTQVRSRIVNRAQLNKLGLKLGFDKLIEADLRSSSANSLVGDAFEAFIGAVYLDRGFITTRKFVIERIIKIHLDLDEIEQTDTDFKSKLINYCQREKKKINFNLVEEVGKGMKKEFVIAVEINGKEFSRSQHSSKRKAEQRAAELTIISLGNKINAGDN
ncbi:MAG: ribonuclease III [Bacteroidota bacterium]|nr:ribonuclease III [Bacteroidota bacterium]